MARPKGNTAEKIKKEALLLFSVNGYEAVSIRDIASAVGIKNSSLYNHFAGKREIYDAIIETARERILAQKSKVTDQIRGIENLQKVCREAFAFQSTDEWIVPIRKLLILEQYRDEEAASLYKELFIDTPIQNMINIFKVLQEKGLMIEGDPELYAIELYSPFYLHHMVPDNSKHLLDLYDQHVEHFFRVHFIKETK